MIIVTKPESPEMSANTNVLYNIGLSIEKRKQWREQEKKKCKTTTKKHSKSWKIWCFTRYAFQKSRIFSAIKHSNTKRHQRRMRKMEEKNRGRLNLSWNKREEWKEMVALLFDRHKLTNKQPDIQLSIITLACGKCACSWTHLNSENYSFHFFFLFVFIIFYFVSSFPTQFHIQNVEQRSIFFEKLLFFFLSLSILSFNDYNFSFSSAFIQWETQHRIEQ